MQGILLTQADGIIMGPVSKLLGIIMNAIFIQIVYSVKTDKSIINPKYSYAKLSCWLL